MAKAMTAAAAVPHFYYVEEMAMDKLSEMKRSLAQQVPMEAGVKLTNLPFLIKSLSMALKKFPVMNSTVDEGVTQIQMRGTHTHTHTFPFTPPYFDIQKHGSSCHHLKIQLNYNPCSGRVSTTDPSIHQKIDEAKTLNPNT